jgi:cytochrome c biogenesis protein CcmG/thiol:disulfide interchange protein DsbE
MEKGTFDPRGVPSMLIGKPLPAFTLPGQDGDGFASTDFASGKPVLINFFASWCEPCVQEAPVLMGLRRQGVRLYGIAYKDSQPATAKYLKRLGDPYTRIARDEPGRVAIDWGLTGVPETYLIDGQGIVRWRFVGPMPPEIASADVPALLRKYA